MMSGGDWDWIPPLMIGIPIAVATLNLGLAYWIRRNLSVDGKYGPLTLAVLWLALLFLTLVLWYGLATPFGVYLGLGEVGWHGTIPGPSNEYYDNYIQLIELSFLFKWTLGNYVLIVLLAGLDALIFAVVKPKVRATKTIVLSSIRSHENMTVNIGQESQPTSRESVLLDRFNGAFNRHDIDAIMSMMTEDCIFDNTFPPLDGTRYEGQTEVRRAWEELFRSSPNAHFEVEEIFVNGERAVQLWTYRWVDAQGVAGHVRGVDVFRFRDGKIAEKLSYVKG